MTRTPRASGAPLYAAVGIAILALLVAATTTAFAAGLAANSVGTKQLKKNAVSAKKIKNNAVTNAKIKDGAVTVAKIAQGAVTADRIAPGVVPAKTVHVSRTLPTSGSTTPLLQLGGLSFAAACNAALQDFVEVSVTRVGGGTLVASGIFSLETSSSETSYPFVDDGSELEVFVMAPSNGGFGALAFNGVVTPTGLGAVQVQVTVQVDDGNANPCQTFVTATPIG